MAVSKQIYSLSSSWTANELADMFRSAFIGAGLMTEWHSSFLSGSVENRILEVQYQPAKTYGKTYYWFMFTTSGAFFHIATGWDKTTDVPTGIQYQDFFSTTKNSTANHHTILSLSTSNAVSLTRYSSGERSGHSWFTLSSSTTLKTFHISPSNEALQTWIDLDLFTYNGFITCIPWDVFSGGSSASSIIFRNPCYLRRSINIQGAFNGYTTASGYASQGTTMQNCLSKFTFYGKANNAYSTNFGWELRPWFVLPYGFSSSNPAFVTDSVPVCSSIPVSPYLQNSLPSDFGIAGHYSTDTITLADTFSVQPSLEEWEVVSFCNPVIDIGSDSPKTLFLARTV